MLEGDEFADGAIGLTDDCRVVYSYEKIVLSLMEAYSDEGEDDIDTLTIEDWLEHDTLRVVSGTPSDSLIPVIIREF